MTSSRSASLRGLRSLIHWLMRRSSSMAFSWGKTGFTVLACEPSLSALSLARALPASVLGPVLRLCISSVGVDLCLACHGCGLGEW